MTDIDTAVETSQFDKPFQNALELVRKGALADAERQIRAILSESPKDHRSLHLLAVVAQQGGNLPAALELVGQVTDLDPGNAAYHNTAGFFLRLAGQGDAAITALEEAIRLKPDYVEALNNLGITLSEQNRFEAALDAYERALAVQPSFAEALNNIGNISARSGNFDDAITRYDAALAIRPDYAEAHANKGDTILAKDKDARSAAIACYEKAVETNPRNPDTWLKLGTARQAENDLPGAEEALRASIRLNPKNIRALTTFAAILEKLGNLKGAASHLRQALTVAPDDLTALKSLGHITLKMGNAVEAKHVLERAKELAPADPDTLYSYANALLRMEQLQPAMDLYLRVRELQPNQARGTFAPAAVLLMDGQYEKGFAAYESRYNMSAFKPNVPDIRERLWDGSPLNGRRLLVHVEQGYGDTLQFCRYIPLIRQRMGTGGTIIFLTEPESHRLLSTLSGVDEIHHLREQDLKIIYDVQVPVLSLPHRFGTSLATVPNTVPYLSVPEAAKRQTPLPSSPGTVVKAGIVWTGRPTHSDNLYRSIPLDELATLFDIDGVDFHSLQVGVGVSDFKRYLHRENCFEYDGALKDFADTAAVISELDVVVTVDTAVCHLAGALGKDVWTMIPYGGEWRWLRNREDTPWYPTMKLVRQRVLGDWGIVLERVREGLEGAVAQRRQGVNVAGDQSEPNSPDSSRQGKPKKAGPKKGTAKKAKPKKVSAKRSSAKKSKGSSDGD